MNKNLIILHGWNSSPAKWNNLKKELDKNGLKVFTPALPGFKKQLNKPWALKDYCIWLNNYCQKNNLTKTNILGHSFGGRISLKFAELHPSLVNKIILVNSAGIVTGCGFKKEVFKVTAKIGKIIFKLPIIKAFKNPARWFLYKLAGEQDYFQASPFLQKTMENIIDIDLRKTAAALKTPVLILWGAEDQITPLKYARIFNKNISNSSLKVYPGYGHDLPFKNPDLITKEIINFVKNV